jgi:hypothetical protein
LPGLRPAGHDDIERRKVFHQGMIFENLIAREGR